MVQGKRSRHDKTSAPEAASERKRGRLPLFLALLGVVLLVAVAPIGVFSLLTVRDMRDTLTIARQEQQLDLAAGAAERLDAFLAQEGRETVRLGAAIGNLDRNAGTRPLRFLNEFLDDTVVLLRFRPVNGQPSVAVAPELVVDAALEAQLDRDAALLLEQGAAPGPPSARDAVLGGPFALGPERILAITVSAPVQRRGRLLGVLQEVALFQQVWSDVERAVPPPMRLFLVSADGRLVARSRHAARTDDSPVADREIVREFLGSRGRSRGARAYTIELETGERRPCLGSWSSTGHGWGVFVEVDEDLALAPIQELMHDIGYSGLLAASLALGATLILAGMISRPMARLAAISTRLAGGDFSVRASNSRFAELDELAGNYNLMATRLGELVERFRAAARDANAMFLGTIRALAEAIDEKDPYTKGHSVRVNRYAVIIGRYLGLSREDIRLLHVSALLHDVGKIGIDDSILKKPAALTQDEFEVMKSHPERGAKIMGRIPQMGGIVAGMRFHHERWNGSGYPSGLKELEIPLQARIVAVADTFDAMTTDRPYQRAFTVEDAVSRINDLKGIGLAPEVVEAFNRAYEAGEFDEVLRTRPHYFAPETPQQPPKPKPKPQHAAKPNHATVAVAIRNESKSKDDTGPHGAI